MLNGLKRAIWSITPLERTVEHLRAVRLRRTHPEGRVPPRPNRIVIESTNACNLSCGYCGNKAARAPRRTLAAQSRGSCAAPHVGTPVG